MAALRMIEDPPQFSPEALVAEVLSFEDAWIKQNDPWRKETAKALADVKAALGRKEDVETRGQMFRDYEDLDSAEFPTTPWLVGGLVTRGGLAILGAEPKSCKTWLATEIAVSVACGGRVCGEYPARRGRVAYFYAEDMDVQVRNRVRAILAGKDLPSNVVFGSLFVCPRGKFLDITRDEDLAWIIASCRMLGTIDLVVLDPLRDISSAAEDKSDEMAPVMKRLRLIGELLGCTVAIAHHAGKQTKDNEKRRPGQRLRGSGAIHGSTDSGIYFGLREGGDNVTRFELEMNVEIKGARSAGNFGLVLELEDDKTGAAVKATWRVTDGVTPKPGRPKAKDQESDIKALRFVRELAVQGVKGSVRFLRDHDDCPLSDKLMRDALQRLLTAGQLIKNGLEIEIGTNTRGDS